MPEKATRCVDEYAALDAFCERMQQLDPDVITGWNIVDFDFTVLQRIAARVRHPFKLGRDAGAMRIRKAEGYFGSGQATIPGRLVLDGIDLLRGAFVRMDDYSLDAVAREVLGEGKAVQRRRARSPRRDPSQLPARSAGVRALCAHRCAARVRDRREARSRAARVRAQPA